MTVAAADALLRLATIARPVDPVLSDWASQAGRKLAAGIDPATSLGMDRRTLARLHRAERNRLLRDAFAMVPGAGPWSRALRLSAEIDRAETTVFRHWQAAGGPPPGASRLRTLLWRARQAGRLPGPRMLAEICRQC